MSTPIHKVSTPIHQCPEVWFNPEFPDVGMGWSWKFDFPDPLTDTTPWRLGLDLFLGQHVVFERGGVKAIWKIVDVDHQAGLLLGRWPD